MHEMHDMQNSNDPDIVVLTRTTRLQGLPPSDISPK